MMQTYKFTLLSLSLIIFFDVSFGESVIKIYNDNKIRVAASRIDITPTYFETFVDLNNNGKFDGFLKKPDGEPERGIEPYNDKNGNKFFDAVWIAGFGNGRAAQGINDPIWARCLIITHKNEYVIFIVYDLIGLLQNRIAQIKDELEKIGIDRNKVIISCTHNHQGPDTIGLWGYKIGKSGINKEYLDEIVNKTIKLVKNTLPMLQPAKVKFGKIRIRDISASYNGTYFGGNNPLSYQIGLINDIRDPVIVDDMLLVMKFDSLKGKTIATFVNWTGHPEVLGSNNNYLTSDYVHYLREKVEKDLGGISIFAIGATGGMMSSLGAKVPIPSQKNVFAKSNTFEMARVLGEIIADAVKLSLKKSKYENIKELKVLHREVKFPIENRFYHIASASGIFEINFDSLPKDENGNPLVSNNIYYVKFGSAEMITVPGEILPELVDGIPDDVDFFSSRPNKYFPQHKNDDKLTQHLEPFVLREKPVRSMMRGEYKFVIGLCDNEIGYIIPEDDFNRDVSPLGYQGDHYEETNSLGPKTAPVLIDAIEKLLEEAYGNN